MPSWDSYSYLFGPLVAFGAVGVLVLLLRWTFSRGSSVVARAGRPGRSDAYGLLVAVAEPPTYVEGEVLRRRLVDAGIRATLAQTLDGPRVMVFEEDERAARVLLSG